MHVAADLSATSPPSSIKLSVICSKQDLFLVCLNCFVSLWRGSKPQPFKQRKHHVTMWRGSKPQPFKRRRLAFTGGSCVGAVCRSSALRLILGQPLAHFVHFGQLRRGALLRKYVDCLEIPPAQHASDSLHPALRALISAHQSPPLHGAPQSP